MANKLVIVESPTKARAISRFLGKGYTVEASYGHIRDLPKSSLGVDIEHDFEPKYITIRGCGDIVARLRKEAKEADTVLLATDPDREGEAISWHLAFLLGIDYDSLCRVEFHEITAKAVREAIKKPRRIDLSLVDAQQARRVLDRLVGYQISPILWNKVRKGLSAGRVQSVAARLVDDREKEIEAFREEEFWTISAFLRQKGKKAAFRALLETKDRFEINSEEAANDVVKSLTGCEYIVRKVTEATKRRSPAPPFTTSQLQQDASRKLGFTTKKTMSVAQQLFEGIELPRRGTVGLVTYIRTDSTRVSDEAVNGARTFINDKFGPDYLPEKPNVFGKRKNAQDAHEAIRPTSLDITPESVAASLTRDQLKLYKLIFDRFIASQMTAQQTLVKTYNISAGNRSFRASGTKVLHAGYTAVYTEGRDANAAEPEEGGGKVPDLKEGEVLDLEKLLPEQHFTQPPPRYTEASLIHTLEEKGIGRPSTYAPVISTIIDRGYVVRKKTILYPTELGSIVTGIMKDYFRDIVNVEFTANIETELDKIEDGSLKWQRLINEFYGPFEKDLKKAESTMERVEIQDEQTNIPCEKCGAMMVIKTGRYGKFYACPNFPACRNTKPILRTIDTPCPKCGGRLVIKTGKRKGRIFYGCENYPKCDFTSWDRPLPVKCPKCGAYMVYRQGRNGSGTAVCSNADCGHSMPYKLEGDQDAAQ